MRATPISGAGSGGAPTDAHYLTDQAEAGLSAEVVVTANGKSLVTAANYAAMRALLGHWDYTSSATTIALGTLYTFAHGLGAKPSDFFVSLICITAESGWAVNDEIEFFAYGDSAWTSHQGYGWDATNIYVWVNASALAGFQKGGGANLTASKWNLIARARL